MIYSWKQKIDAECGVLCGCDQSQEWLLSWWWERYSAHNAFPVTFIDFGMSKEAKSFCCTRGECITLEIDSSFIKKKEELAVDLVQSWEAIYGTDLWTSRMAWFKKPFALLHSRYRKALWLDLDCEVIGSIEPLFAYCQSPDTLAQVREFSTEHIPPGDARVRYNGGVIVFSHGHWIIEEWAKEAHASNHLYSQSDTLLASIVYAHQLQVLELPKIYNWRIVEGVNPLAVIYHWVGKKNYIRTQGGIKPSLQALR